MDPSLFFPTALPWARIASRLTNVPVSVILAQWAVETGYGGPDWSPRNNPGNVGDTEAGGQVVYPTLAAGVTAYVSTMLLPYYEAVRMWPAPWSDAEADASALALGKSPWAAGHYDAGTGPGSALLAVMSTYDLYQYNPTPGEIGAPEMTHWTAGGQEHVAGEVNGKAYHWWQQTPTGDPAHPADPTWHVEELPL